MARILEHVRPALNRFAERISKAIHRTFKFDAYFRGVTNNQTAQKDDAMQALRNQLHTLRQFVWPTYRPECHYMRGPGPACRIKQVHTHNRNEA